LVQEIGLFVGVNRTDGDAVHAARDEGAQDRLLRLHGGIGEEAEVHLDIAEILRCRL